MGSNEYLACVCGLDREGILQIAEEIQKSLQENTDGKPKVLQPVTMSIGIAMETFKAAGYNELLKQAERATFLPSRMARIVLKFMEIRKIPRKVKRKIPVHMNRYHQQFTP